VHIASSRVALVSQHRRPCQVTSFAVAFGRSASRRPCLPQHLRMHTGRWRTVVWQLSQRSKLTVRFPTCCHAPCLSPEGLRPQRGAGRPGDSSGCTGVGTAIKYRHGCFGKNGRLQDWTVPMLAKLGPVHVTPQKNTNTHTHKHTHTQCMRAAWAFVSHAKMLFEHGSVLSPEQSHWHM
jgi:hypothetical protein